MDSFSAHDTPHRDTDTRDADNRALHWQERYSNEGDITAARTHATRLPALYKSACSVGAVHTGTAHASITQATDPTMPRAARARRASGGKNEGVATWTPTSLSVIVSVRGATFSDATVALAAAFALDTAPAVTRTQQHQRGHAGLHAHVRQQDEMQAKVVAAVLRLASPALTRSSC